MRVELTDRVRGHAFAYVDEVVARAEGKGGTASELRAEQRRRAMISRLVPGAVKRFVVRSLVYVLRHPFDHLTHRLETKLEEEIGQVRGVALAALTRAERTDEELRRLRSELRRSRQSP